MRKIPDAVVRVARWAVEYRYRFASDVVIDLIGYRRHGHSEVDDPTITQPIVYRKIKEHPPLYEIYARRIGADASPQVERMRARDAGRQEAGAADEEEAPALHAAELLGCLHGRSVLARPGSEDRDRRRGKSPGWGRSLRNIRRTSTSIPRSRSCSSSGWRWRRANSPSTMAWPRRWPSPRSPCRALRSGSAARTAAAAPSIIGTRTLIDVEDEHEYVPLCHLSPEQARVEIYNSELSEAAVLGFEYGYSRDYPEALVMWEAQFGDFANGAQIIIDQFISAGEEKWGLLTGLVMLLPHGYEGQGPEHSSARIERYLQLCARDNMQVCQPSSAAQYFHLLRRQALRAWRKPLICFTPKSMLRNPEAMSPLEAFTGGRFELVIADEQVPDPKRVLLCSGKIGHELVSERKRRNDQ